MFCWLVVYEERVYTTSEEDQILYTFAYGLNIHQCRGAAYAPPLFAISDFHD
jgi:hypothetical protein